MTYLNKINDIFYQRRTQKLIEFMYIYQSTFGYHKNIFIIEGKSNEEYEAFIDRLIQEPETPNGLFFDYNTREYKTITCKENDEYYIEKLKFSESFVRSVPHQFFIECLYKQPVNYDEFAIYAQLRSWLFSMKIIANNCKFSELKLMDIKSTGYNLEEATRSLILLINQCYRFRCASQQRPYTPDEENNPDIDFYEQIRRYYRDYKTPDELLNSNNGAKNA